MTQQSDNNKWGRLTKKYTLNVIYMRASNDYNNQKSDVSWILDILWHKKLYLSATWSAHCLIIETRTLAMRAAPQHNRKGKRLRFPLWLLSLVGQKCHPRAGRDQQLESELTEPDLTDITTGLCGLCVEGGEDATLPFVCFYFFSHQAPQVNNSVEFRSVSSPLQLHSRAAMVENIYEIDGGGEGSVYQYLP